MRITAVLLLFATAVGCGGSEPAATAPRTDPSVEPNLPSVPTDDTTLRYAREAYRAAVAHQCDAARTALTQVQQRDRTYYVELVEVPAIEPCR